ncbi:ABC transporter permease [Aneurinibacillus sp. REN35]|uniref:ABC transporter permease n=1 Tax=Aneurinibacillus sp. REN35 TaxID=3237286 RepID=UPI00352961F2
MYSYLLKRIFSIIPVLFVVLTVVFFVIHITPGDPAAVMLGPDATAQQIEELREQWGLNLPIYQQYMNWIIAVLQGDLGVSYFMDQPVIEAIWSHIGPTFALAVMAQILALVIAIPLGILAAKYHGSIIDRMFMGVSLLGICVPSFLLGLFFILLFAVQLKWLPVAGYQPISAGLWEYLRHLIMPAVALGTMQAALLARMARSSLLDTLSTDFIKTARSKGVKERNVIYKHALRNALLPLLTVIGQSFGGLITGAVVTETIFNIPGIGQLIIDSIERRDFSVIQGAVLFVTVAFVFVNLIVDLLYGVIDPRVRLGRK